METMDVHQDPSDNPQTSSGQAVVESERLKRKRQARNSACQACASLKMKCVAQANGICERCDRMNRDCVPSIPKARKRQTIDGSQPQDVLLEESILASLGTPVPPPRFDPPSAHKRTVNEADRSSLLSKHDLSHTGSKSFISLFSRGLGIPSACEELLQGVDYNFVANSFTIFRQLTPYFPFIEISPAADVITMVARRPALTLAVCTVAAASSPKIQDYLSQAFLYALSSKAVIGSENSLDLFTGLLVYLAWHHHYLSHQQTYQKLCLLAGMAADLGLYRFSLSSMDNPTATLEQNRAFVGCYYLCSSLSATGYNKPNPLRWTDNLRRASENASIAGTLPTDRELIPCIELMLCLNDIEEVARDLNGGSPVSAHHMDLHARASLHRLKALKREHPSLAGSLRYAAVHLHVYQRLLRSGIVTDSSTLIQCACAVKEYTDDLLARHASLLHQMAIADWSNLLEILLLMAKVSKPSTGGWEAGALTSMLQPEVVLESLCAHMASTPSNDPLIPRHEGLLQRFRNVCESIRRRFLFDSGPGSAVNAQTDGTSLNGHIQQEFPARSRSGAADDPVQRPNFDGYSYFGDGVLDPHFWTSLTSSK